MNKNKKEKCESDFMALDAWQRVSIAAGGGLFLGLAVFSQIDPPESWSIYAAISAIIAGIALIYYARYGGW